jgi:hypothetical protein
LGAGSIQAVTALRRDGQFTGFNITSRVAGHTLIQLILIPPSVDAEFSDLTLGLTFRGRYAVVTLDENGACSALYVGEGRNLSFQGITLSTVSGVATNAAAEFNGESVTLTANAPSGLTLPDGKRFPSATPKM